ncbi:ABC transporter substrate-binding protein [Jeotgalibacillus haloalkalitolerans]|uniref:ABC transporter substrate-binding protein n=1 Tax=Jeotgalibacillus haloalkalitolerans TaxID=3104292 RepID=A0ABU5KJ21_9BACL|nr:ABC transporter substrate-binding protein [Jeotgalibacillus sp. HH7-29]MDZ5711233.1 ABC transporter substrate-binding protein [Jeotgalibacillus sp. HH7-29]
MKKSLLTVASGLAVASVLAACSGDDTSSSSEGSSGTQEITFWAPFSGADGPNMEQIVNEFNDSQDEVQVDFQIVPQSEYYTTLDLSLSGQQEGADVMIMHGDQIMTYANQNIIKNLDDIVGDQIDKENYHPTAWEGAEVDGSIYGVPLDIHPLMFYYNKDLFEAAGLDPEAPPTNREEFLEAAKATTNADEGQYGFAVPTLWPQQFIFPSIVYQNGGELITDDGEVQYDSPEAVEALEFLHSLIYDHEVSPADIQQDGELTLFLQGKSAMHMNGPWMMNQFEESGLNYGVAPVPQLGTEQQAVFANSHNFVIPETVQDEAKIDAITTFLNYVDENGMAWAESGQAPASKAVYESDEFNEMKQQPEVAKQFEYVQFSPNVENWGPVSDPLFSAVNEVLLNQREAQEALEQAAQDAQASLQ